MTKVKVVAGACGFTSVIKVTSLDHSKVSVEIFSACNDLRAMAADFREISWQDGVFVRLTDSYVHKKAGQRLKHADCPIPSAILKAILIEVGAMSPRDVTMKFEKYPTGEEIK